MSYKTSLLQTLTTSLTSQSSGSPLYVQYSAPAMSDSRSGVALPQYKQIIAQGGNAVTPFTGVKYSAQLLDRGYAKAEYQLASGSYWELLEGVYPALNFVPYHPHNPNNFVADADRQALARFAAAVRKTRMQISGPTFLGELRDTIKIFTRPTEALFKHLSRYLDRVYSRSRRRGRGRRRPPTRREIALIAADEWLTYQLAIRPLMADVEDIAIAVARMISETRHTIVRGYAKIELRYGESGPWTASNYWGGVYTRAATQSVETIYRGGLHAAVFDADFGALAKLQQLVGFDASQFVPTVYELIPGSFVLDYFVNVGELLAFANTDFSDVKWLSRTRRFHTEWLSSSTLFSRNAAQLKGWTGGSELGRTRMSVTTVSRVAAVPSTLSLDAYFTLPGVASRWATLAALLVSGFSNGGRKRP